MIVRAARRDEIPELIDFLIAGRAHVAGSRRRVVFRALIADSFGPHPKTTIAVAEVDGQLASGLVAVNADLPSYYRLLPLHHPVAAAALALHRARNLPARLRRRLLARRVDPGAVHAPHAETPAVLLSDERLQQPPRPASGPGPHATDHGPDIAYCLTLIVGRGHRGQGLSKATITATLAHLKALGARRYDCSFSPSDPIAARLYLSMPFDIQRFPAGYFASIALADVEPARLPS